MPLYDFRLFNRAGALILLYQAMCESDAHAVARTDSLKSIRCARLEVWLEESLLMEQEQV